MPGVKSLQLLCALACGLSLVACPGPRGPATGGAGKKEDPGEAGPPAGAVTTPTPPAPTGVGKAAGSVTGSTPGIEAGKKGPPGEAKLGRVRDDVPLPLTSLLGQPIAAAQGRLGEHLGKGMTRESCVRHVPERVFFACEYAVQRYADPTGTFAGVRLEYEDGLVAGVSLDGWQKGSGPFDPDALLAAVGLELPEPPRVDSPGEGVRRWAWFNDRARLKIGERQYRVEVSVVGDDWSRSRVEVVLNDPLSEAQKAKLLRPGAAEQASP